MSDSVDALREPEYPLPSAGEEYGQLLDIFDGLFARHIVNDGFEYRREVGARNYVVQIMIDLAFDLPDLAQSAVVVLGPVDIELH